MTEVLTPSYYTVLVLYVCTTSWARESSPPELRDLGKRREEGLVEVLHIPSTNLLCCYFSMGGSGHYCNTPPRSRDKKKGKKNPTLPYLPLHSQESKRNNKIKFDHQKGGGREIYIHTKQNHHHHHHHPIIFSLL